MHLLKNSLGVTGSSGNDHQSINQLISSPGGSTYLIQGAANEGGIVAMPISHSSRASPATVSLYFRREPKTVSNSCRSNLKPNDAFSSLFFAQEHISNSA